MFVTLGNLSGKMSLEVDVFTSCNRNMKKKIKVILTNDNLNFLFDSL